MRLTESADAVPHTQSSLPFNSDYPKCQAQVVAYENFKIPYRVKLLPHIKTAETLTPCANAHVKPM